MNKILTLALALSAGLAAGVAQAATLSFNGPGGLRGTLDCSAACEGLLVDDSWSSTSADMFTVHPPNAATELAFVNSKVPETFTSGTKDETTNAPTDSNALYVLFKLGGGNTYATALVHNISGGAITYTWTAVSGTGSGLSHTTSFGSVSEVPLPAAGLLLFGSLGAFGAMRRKRKS